MMTSDERVQQMLARLGHFAFGGDYNPEQWTPAMGYDGETIWDEDFRLMRVAGVNIATLGVFSWVSLQPAEDRFTFDWLDRIMDRLAENGIFACLATGTAAQPAWLSARYPEVLPTNSEGRRQEHGERQNYCPTSTRFRQFARALAQRLAERYRDHPALLLWHVSNEYRGMGQRNPNRCYCDQCAVAFRLWLRNRYHTLDALNAAWVTTFWGHTFTDWDQIAPPRAIGERSQPALRLDYQRFISDQYLGCYRNEAEVLRAVTPDIPITTNFMGTFKPLDYATWAPDLDIIAHDSYPYPQGHPSETAFQFDVIRGLKPGQPWLLMESVPNQVNWMPQNALKRPGVMRLESYQAIAHGAASVMYFQWRQSRGGHEQFHGAVVGHAGHENTRVFREVTALGQELQHLPLALTGAAVPARVAMLWSWPNRWALGYDPQLHHSLNPDEEARRYYRALWDHHLAVDVISPDADLARYDLVIAPMWHLVTASQAASVAAYVAGGGTFLTTYFSGVLDDTGRAWLGGYPGPLRETLGIWVEEYDPFLPTTRNAVRVAGNVGVAAGTYGCDLWGEVVHLEGAQALGSFTEDFYTGGPAITEHSVGQGKAYYVATRLAPEGVSALIGWLARERQIFPAFDVPAEIEIGERITGEQRHVVLLNHGEDAVTVPLSPDWQLILGSRDAGGGLTLPPRGVAIAARPHT